MGTWGGVVRSGTVLAALILLGGGFALTSVAFLVYEHGPALSATSLLTASLAYQEIVPAVILLHTRFT